MRFTQIFFFLTLTTICLAFSTATAQDNDYYWQQHVDYTMEIDMDVKDFQYAGTQELVYTNNSPDTLYQVFYHLYFNAFQPGSQMDVRSRTIADPDERVGDRISKLGPDEIGYLKVESLKQDGEKVEYETVGTVLEVTLPKPILPGEKTTFKMKFNGQVPVQIRRSGRNNAEGVSLSMTQWYPKMAEYDFEGWHADPYIGREFHGVWGDFDVKITIDKDYIIAASGYLQNGNEIGYNYQDEGVEVKRRGKTLTWHFVAPKVHDFTWAADPDYIHDKLLAEDGTMLHFFYQDKPEIIENWKKLQPITEKLLLFYNEHIGPYPWKQYTVAQGGDGGMEYAMITLITGGRELGSLVGVTAHEFAHAWFQHLLATNESKHEWMDEGFTTYISTLIENQLRENPAENPFERTYRGYVYLANSGKEQPMTTHADRYEYNMAYGLAAYSKGAIFLAQLEYVIGEENLAKTLNRYYDVWKFKHPTPNDFIRVAEKVSGAELDWYLTDFTRTTNTIDYAIKEVSENEGKTMVTLERIDRIPMPIELTVTYTDGSKELVYIPLQMMRWEKPDGTSEEIERIVKEDWGWAYPTYEFSIDRPKNEIEQIEIDASDRLADVNRENNVWENQL
ncbi:MAG TPA: M1 family metallopeptidase [Flavobacteriaceae bacterium]|nr:M1 family metallopeptidase [Flavobacteriaceae bacterium]